MELNLLSFFNLGHAVPDVGATEGLSIAAAPFDLAFSNSIIEYTNGFNGAVKVRQQNVARSGSAVAKLLSPALSVESYLGAMLIHCFHITTSRRFNGIQLMPNFYNLMIWWRSG